jgi:hypothetical protein
VLGTVALAAQLPRGASAQALQGDISGEYRYFFKGQTANPVAGDYRGDATAGLHLKYGDELPGDAGSYLIDARATADQHDKHRNRVDFNELSWRHGFGNVSVLAGMHTEFWGVTESWHLVDVLNQTDLTPNIDQHVKLGQMTLKTSLQGDLGNVSLYVLPLFRERVFPDEHARLKPAYDIDAGLATYESSRGKHHVDLAARYSQTLGQWDIGISHFNGTGREPLLLPVIVPGKPVVLAPYYEQIRQTGIDAQMTADGLLVKLEAIRHSSRAQPTYRSAVAGLEYTLVGVFGSAADVGLLAEYLYERPVPGRALRGQRRGADDLSAGYLHQPEHACGLLPLRDGDAPQGWLDAVPGGPGVFPGNAARPVLQLPRRQLSDAQAEAFFLMCFSMQG